MRGGFTVKIKVEKKVNEDKSVTVIIDFEQEIPSDLVNILGEHGVTDLMNEATIYVENTRIQKGALRGIIQSTTYL